MCAFSISAAREELAELKNRLQSAQARLSAYPSEAKSVADDSVAGPLYGRHGSPIYGVSAISTDYQIPAHGEQDVSDTGNEIAAIIGCLRRLADAVEKALKQDQDNLKIYRSARARLETGAAAAMLPQEGQARQAISACRSILEEVRALLQRAGQVRHRVTTPNAESGTIDSRVGFAPSAARSSSHYALDETLGLSDENSRYLSLPPREPYLGRSGPVRSPSLWDKVHEGQGYLKAMPLYTNYIALSESLRRMLEVPYDPRSTVGMYTVGKARASQTGYTSNMPAY